MTNGFYSEFINSYTSVLFTHREEYLWYCDWTCKRYQTIFWRKRILGWSREIRFESNINFSTRPEIRYSYVRYKI